jgi:hypothetical protein
MKNDSNTKKRLGTDLLLYEALEEDPSFADLFLAKAELCGEGFEKENTELFITGDENEAAGITVLLKGEGGSSVALLIENDPGTGMLLRPYERQRERGDAGVREGKFDEYLVFLVCPKEKFLREKEAQRYEFFVSYEECLEYFRNCDAKEAENWAKQMEKAIEMAESTPGMTCQDAANRYYGSYREYLREYIPEFVPLLKAAGEARYAHYDVGLGDAYILHRLEEGYVDLVFPGKAERIGELSFVMEHLRDNGCSEISSCTERGDCLMRIEVPKQDMRKEFQRTGDVDEGYDMVHELMLIARFAGDIAHLASA